MRNVGLVLAIVFLVLSFIIQPAESWTYSDGSPEDAKFERFGPRADKLLIKLYENETAEWNALARGEIDITDWPLTKAYHDLLVSNETNPATGFPYNETINTVNYGSERSFFILDMNNDPREYLTDPPDPSFPNPVYPNPCSVVEFRQAIAHLVDRSQLDAIIGEQFYSQLYTVVPPYMGAYYNQDIEPGGSLENLTYPYSRANAESILNANGFPINPSTGWRFWDTNGDGVEQSDEYLELKFLIRRDDPHRSAFGDFVADELEAVKVRVNRCGYSWAQIIDRSFHLYTGRWTLGVDPDHLILWHSSLYWPGFCPNYAYVNDQELDEYIDGVIDAQTSEEALENSWAAQKRFAEIAGGIPLWTSIGFKAMNRHYTGGTAGQAVNPDDGENEYRGQYWKGTVNKPAYGTDNFWSFLNMHPANHDRANSENMTIRWGFKVNEIKMLNPVYSNWLWEWNVLELIYETLIQRNPYNMAEFIPWLAETFEIGNYTHPIHGLCSKIKFKMRADVTWNDGTPLTTADVYFTLVELDNILERRGLPRPWWYSNIADVLDLKLLDAYNFEVLFDDYEYWMLLSRITGVPILPKHIWKPIVEGGDPQAFAPDPDMIGTGPWRLEEYVENSHVLLVANGIESTVQTNLPGSTLITSLKGYYRYFPVAAEARVDGTTGVKIDYYANHTIDYRVCNFYDESIMIDINITYPDGTKYDETGITIQAKGNWTHSWTGNTKHLNTTSMLINAFSPWEFRGLYYWSQIYYGTLISYSMFYRSSTDIVGSTYYNDIGLGDYPFKWQLPTPDIKIDIKDIAQAAIAFGSYPGHRRIGSPGGSRWNMGVADINNDYKIDIKDIAMIARGFGWTG